MICNREALLMSLALGLLCVLLPAAARGDVIYSYIGDDFVYYGDGDSSAVQTNITATIDLSSALVDNFNGSVDPVSWEISDGNITVTNLSSDVAHTVFYFETDAMGQIISYTVDVEQTNSAPGYAALISETGADGSDTCGGTDLDSCGAPGSYAYVPYFGDQPAFSVTDTAVPEPISIALLLPLMGSVLIFSRLRKKLLRAPGPVFLRGLKRSFRPPEQL